MTQPRDGEEATLTINEKGNRHRTIGIHFAAAEAIAEYIARAKAELAKHGVASGMGKFIKEN